MLLPIEHAKQLGADVTNLSYVCGRVEELKSPPYDIVILSEVLEHLREPRVLLSAAVAHLNKNGTIIVTVPNGYGEFEIDSWVFRVFHLQRIVDAVAGNSKQVTAATDNRESGTCTVLYARPVATALWLNVLCQLTVKV